MQVYNPQLKFTRGSKLFNMKFIEAGSLGVVISTVWMCVMAVFNTRGSKTLILLNANCFLGLHVYNGVGNRSLLPQ